MTDQPTICTVIPAYNRAHLIAEALDSILSQTRLPNEVIVVDDGSTDDTVHVVRNWSEKHQYPLKILQQSNRGAAAARNTAIRQTQADLIAPLDSDDVWMPHHIEILERAFIKHPQMIVCAGNTKRLDDLPLFKNEAYGEDLFRGLEYDVCDDGLRMIRGSAFTSLLRGAYIQTSSCMFQRQAACDVGLLDESLKSYEDQLFFLRLSRRGSFGLYMEPVTLLRKHDDNLTHRRHIASHIICSISALEKALTDAKPMNLSADETNQLRAALDRRLERAAERASRYGLRPYWKVCADLFRRGSVRQLLRPKAALRAVLRPNGDQNKLQQKTKRATTDSDARPASTKPSLDATK